MLCRRIAPIKRDLYVCLDILDVLDFVIMLVLVACLESLAFSAASGFLWRTAIGRPEGGVLPKRDNGLRRVCSEFKHFRGA